MMPAVPEPLIVPMARLVEPAIVTVPLAVIAPVVLAPLSIAEAPLLTVNVPLMMPLLVRVFDNAQDWPLISSVAPDATVIDPLPSAVGEPSCRVPLDRRVVPVNEFEFVRSTVPAPSLVSPPLPDTMLSTTVLADPPKVSV